MYSWMNIISKSKARFCTSSIPVFLSYKCLHKKSWDEISSWEWKDIFRVKLFNYVKSLLLIFQKSHCNYPTWVALLVGASSHTPKGCRFDPGRGAHGRHPVNVSLSHRCFSLSVSPFLSLSNQ